MVVRNFSGIKYLPSYNVSKYNVTNYIGYLSKLLRLVLDN